MIFLGQKMLVWVRLKLHRHLKLWDLFSWELVPWLVQEYLPSLGTAAATLAGPSLVVSIVISALCVSLSALFFC